MYIADLIADFTESLEIEGGRSQFTARNYYLYLTRLLDFWAEFNPERDMRPEDITDEFLPPMLLNKDAIIKENDGLLWLNFRPDRARQILNALSHKSLHD